MATIRTFFLFVCGSLLGSLLAWGTAIGQGVELPKVSDNPNIILILCDDLGYGDVHCLAPATSRIPTPHADALARQGMIMTDVHSGSSVCSPTRYGLLTGRYCWRTRLQKGVVTGYAPSLIDADRPTIGTFLQRRGYHTAVIGKWHLDFQYLDPTSGVAYRRQEHPLPPIGSRIPDGPIHRGFHYFHGFHHARDMRAVIENDRVIEHDDVMHMLPRLTAQAVDYIATRSSDTEPFFLYLPLGSPHTPIVPTPEWQGKSGLGDYGDFVMQTDHALGEVCAALRRHKLEQNTIVIFSSDNGCSKAAGIQQLAAQGHQVSGIYRGSKADSWEGGHRVPFLIRWPGRIEAGSRSARLVCLTDIFATLADILQTPAPAGSCEDSVSFLPALLGQPFDSPRPAVVHHSVSGHFGYRDENWKLILARGSGGWSAPTEKNVDASAPEAQLYQLATDPQEQHNLYLDRPELANRLLESLNQAVTSGRTTNGPATANDVPNIRLWKSARTGKTEK